MLDMLTYTHKDGTYVHIVLPVFVDICTSDVGKYTAARTTNDAKINKQINK